LKDGGAGGGRQVQVGLQRGKLGVDPGLFVARVRVVEVLDEELLLGEDVAGGVDGGAVGDGDVRVVVPPAGREVDPDRLVVVHRVRREREPPDRDQLVAGLSEGWELVDKRKEGTRERRGKGT